MEYAKEDAKSDEDLHVAAEKMIRLAQHGKLTMAAYDEVFGKEHSGPDGDNDADDKAPEGNEAGESHEDESAEVNEAHEDNLAHKATEKRKEMKKELEVIEQADSLEEAAKGHKIEAYGVKGMKSNSWRKSFKSFDHLADWAEKNSADVHGVRPLEGEKWPDEKEEKKEKLNEVLTASTPVETWIKDFQESDDPKFEGKSKAERRKMALGAYYGAQKK